MIVCLVVICGLNAALVVLTVGQRPSFAALMQRTLAASSYLTLVLIAAGMFGG